MSSIPWFATSGVTVFETEQAVLVPLMTLEGESGGLFSDEPTPGITLDGNLLFIDRIR